ncbi:MAG TPA: acetate kinase [Bacteroides sp.]|nr:acetate kinase [Bacteroides sp.]
MKIIVINCGSSSIKYQLFDMTTREVIAKGQVEKIGLHGSFIKHHRNDGDEVKLEGEIVDHQAGIEYMLGILTSEKRGSLKSFDEIDAVGHRVVHGGEKFKKSRLITNEVLEGITECIDLAPLHNPPNLKGIKAMQALLPKVPQVATFDTAFHQTMPDFAYMYAIPHSLYTKYGLRRYGFHGSSHRYVAKRASEILNKKPESLKLITCHLGNGASMAAIKHGKSMDTSMGLTPVEGLIMGTRTGDLDLGALLFIMHKEQIGLNATNTLINKHSGMLGITGVSSDMREIETEALENNNERAQLGLKMYHYRIKKYIGAYAAAMGGVDAVIFTGGIGENGAESRKEICEELEYMGIEFDAEKNKSIRGKEAIVTSDNSKVKVMVIPTNEELIIAEDTARIAEEQN